MNQIRIIKSKYNGRGYMDSRQELGEVHCVDCNDTITVSMCNRANIKCNDKNPCYNPEPIKLGEIPLRDCCETKCTNVR